MWAWLVSTCRQEVGEELDPLWIFSSLHNSDLPLESVNNQPELSGNNVTRINGSQWVIMDWPGRAPLLQRIVFHWAVPPPVRVQLAVIRTVRRVGVKIFQWKIFQWKMFILHNKGLADTRDIHFSCFLFTSGPTSPRGLCYRPLLLLKRNKTIGCVNLCVNLPTQLGYIIQFKSYDNLIKLSLFV